MAADGIETLPIKDLAVLTSELHFLASRPEGLWAAMGMWSSDLTMLRAQGYVDRAQAEIAQAFADAERKKRERAGKTGFGRRRR